MERKGSKIVSRRQIPYKYRASRPKIVQWIARWFLRLFGWKVDGFIPPLEGKENLIIIAGPHTSNWDGVFGFAAILGLDAKITFFGKHSLFTKPILGKFLKYMGGIPVDKTKPGSGLTDVAIQNMKKLNGSLIAMSPEGTRAKTGMSDTECRVEIERYIVWPGQALSYKVGMIKMLELREKAMNALGDKFDIRDFHSAVLDYGNPPLFIVEEKIDEMIAKSLAGD